MTPSGIEHATFRLVAQCLNQLRQRVPHTHSVLWLLYLPIRLSEEELPVGASAAEGNYRSSEAILLYFWALHRN